MIEGAIELLDFLKDKNYKMCLISKRSHPKRRQQITDLGLDKYFVDIQVIEDKKDESHFKRSINLLDLDPDKIAIIGDRVKGEIRLGNFFKMKTIWFKEGKFSTQLPKDHKEIPNHIIKELSEVKNLI